MDQKQISCKELVREYLTQIEILDRKGPKLHALLTINPDALEEAVILDREREQKGPRSSLHGIPIILKDNVITAGKMPTTAGSIAFSHLYSANDAFLVAQLRKAGALILGKANLSEWANFRSTHSSSGWSSMGRQTHNPYVLDRTPCGSSSGSAVAVAANFCTVAIGTETDGSIVCPSHMNSVVGIKPTVGLVSQSGIIPISHSQDTAGPIARNVADAAIVLNVLIELNPQDLDPNPAKIPILGKFSPKIDYTKFLVKDGLQGARIGVARNFCGYHAEIDSLFNDSIEAMKNAGAVIVDPADLVLAPEIEDLEFLILLYEFKADLNKFLAQYSADLSVHSLSDIIEYNREHASKIMPYFQQEIFEMAQAKGDLNQEEYLQALQTCREAAREQGIDKLLKEYNLDAIIAPTANAGCPIDLINGDHFIGGSSSPAAIAGYPTITVPMGYVHELPVGLSFISTALQEGLLIKLAYSFEQIALIRHQPKYFPTLELE